MTDTPFQKTSEITGKTSDAMRAAPRGAVYVWHSNDLRYPKELAIRLKRTDLLIHSGTLFDGGGNRLRGIALPVVLDHATVLSDDQQTALDKWLALARR